MIKHIEQCSKCKAYVNGEAQRELSRKLISRGTSAGVKKLFGWAIVTPILTSIVPVVGTFFGSSVKCVDGYHVMHIVLM